MRQNLRTPGRRRVPPYNSPPLRSGRIRAINDVQLHTLQRGHNASSLHMHRFPSTNPPYRRIRVRALRVLFFKHRPLRPRSSPRTARSGPNRHTRRAAAVRLTRSLALRALDASYPQQRSCGDIRFPGQRGVDWPQPECCATDAISD